MGSWADPPSTPAEWNLLVSGAAFDEPECIVPAGKKPASGVVVLEPDRRVWAVSPSNQFDSYETTFAKGTLSSKDGLSIRANALKEAGLKIEPKGFLVDVLRSTSFTRYYVGRRVGGSPADMGWESQPVHLVPHQELPAVVAHKNDAPILEALSAYLSRVEQASPG